MTDDAVHALREQGAEIRVHGTFDKGKHDLFIAHLEACIKRIVLSLHKK